MGKRRDQFWAYVVENDTGLQCMFCQFEFARSTSVSRVKYHLARHEMGGIRICTKVPDDVREAAELAIDGPNKHYKTLSTLSYRQAQNNTTASSSWRQSDGVENPVNGVEREETGVQGSGHVVQQWRSPVNEDFIQPLARDTIAEGCRNDWEPMIGEWMEPGVTDVYAIESEAVNMNGDFNVDADSICFNANDEACNHTIASSSLVRNDGVENLVNDVVEREGGVQRSAQVPEEWRSSTPVGVGNLWKNANEALMQPVDIAVSAVGNDAVNWIEDIQSMITDLPVTQLFEIGREAISEDGGNFVENMNRRMASQFDLAVMDVYRENDLGTTQMTSAASTSRHSFDVFLSFRGKDTHKSFADLLLQTLVHARISTFLDDYSIPRGENIESAIPSAIKSSKVAVIVFSEDFASSAWCLDEVAQIMDCSSSGGLLVIPVFYHVDPSDVLKQSGGYRRAFAGHENKFTPERVQKWRVALARVANMARVVHSGHRYHRFSIMSLTPTTSETTNAFGFNEYNNELEKRKTYSMVWDHLGELLSQDPTIMKARWNHYASSKGKRVTSPSSKPSSEMPLMISGPTPKWPIDVPGPATRRFQPTLPGIPDAQEKSILLSGLTPFLKHEFEIGLQGGFTNLRAWWTAKVSSISDSISSIFRVDPSPLLSDMESFLQRVDNYLQNGKDNLIFFSLEEKERELRALTTQSDAARCKSSSLQKLRTDVEYKLEAVEAELSRLEEERVQLLTQVEYIRDQIQATDESLAKIAIRQRDLGAVKTGEVTEVSQIDQLRSELQATFMKMTDTGWVVNID